MYTKKRSYTLLLLLYSIRYLKTNAFTAPILVIPITLYTGILVFSYIKAFRSVMFLIFIRDINSNSILVTSIEYTEDVNDFFVDLLDFIRFMNSSANLSI